MTDKERVDLELRIEKEVAEKIKKKSKAELLGDIVELCMTIETQKLLIRQIRDENRALKYQFNKAEDHIQQGRAMIESILEQWYHYD